MAALQLPLFLVLLTLELVPLHLNTLQGLDMLHPLLVKASLHLSQPTHQFLILIGQCLELRLQLQLFSNELLDMLPFVLSKGLIIFHLLQDLVRL